MAKCKPSATLYGIQERFKHLFESRAVRGRLQKHLGCVSIQISSCPTVFSVKDRNQFELMRFALAITCANKGQNARLSKESIRADFERMAPVWEKWRKRNSYYHASMARLVGGMVVPGSQVLELGSGTGDLLASLKPSVGIGLNVAPSLTARATAKFPQLEFHTAEVDSIELPKEFHPQHLVMTNMLDYVYDVCEMLDSLTNVVSEGTLLTITTNNPIWAPLLRLASKFHLRIPDSPRNFITNKDICSVLHLQGYDVVEDAVTLPVPKRIPVIGTFLNAVIPEIPVVRFASSIQYIAARPRYPRRPLSCSVIVPCHNEAGNIAECIRRVPDMGSGTEIVVIDDGSADGTAAVVTAVMDGDPRVRLISFKANQGKASAVRAGFLAAQGDVLMILDADMAVLPEELPRFFAPLQKGTADFVNGTRLIYPMQGKAMKFANYLGNKTFCYIVSKAIRQRVSDTLCGTKAFLKRDYLRMPAGGTERWGDFDLLFGAARLRLRIFEIPVHYSERRAGKSKMRAFVEVWRFLWACVTGWKSMRFPGAWKQPVPTAPPLHELHPKPSPPDTSPV